MTKYTKRYHNNIIQVYKYSFKEVEENTLTIADKLKVQ